MIPGKKWLSSFWSLLLFFVVIVQSPSRAWLLATLWAAACQASLRFTISGSLLKFISTELAIQPSCPLFVPFSSCLQFFPASGFFLMSQLFTSDGQSIGTSASVLLMNIEGWSPCSPRASQESSPTPHFKSVNSSALSFLYGPNLTSILDYWKNHSFD